MCTFRTVLRPRGDRVESGDIWHRDREYRQSEVRERQRERYRETEREIEIESESESERERERERHHFDRQGRKSCRVRQSRHVQSRDRAEIVEGQGSA